MIKKEIRCNHCNRKLAEGVVILISIKCPRCRNVTTIKRAIEPPQ